MIRKKRQKLRGKVTKIIRSSLPSEPEKAQIDIEGADHLYREIRVENVVVDESGETSGLERGAEVDVILETDSEATKKERPE